METVAHQGREKPFTDNNNNNNNKNNNRTEEKYGLRPRTVIKRLQQEKVRQEVPKKPTKSKSRPAPLSKYRRKTANARERHRMRDINTAFECLRKILPEAAEVEASTSTITKIMTLRLAVEYIKALTYVLEDGVDHDLCSLEGSLHTTIHSSLQSCLQHGFQQHPLQQQYSAASLPPQRSPQLLGQCSSSVPVSGASTPSTLRSSVSSTSDLEELLSDDSGLLEDNFDVFHDIPTLTVADPFDIVLCAELSAVTDQIRHCSEVLTFQ